MTQCFLGRPGSSPSCACPPHGMGFKKGLRAEERDVYSPNRLPRGDSAHPRVLQASEERREASVPPCHSSWPGDAEHHWAHHHCSCREGWDHQTMAGRLPPTPHHPSWKNILPHSQRNDHDVLPCSLGARYRQGVESPSRAGMRQEKDGCVSQPAKEGLPDIFVQLPTGIGPAELPVLS